MDDWIFHIHVFVSFHRYNFMGFVDDSVTVRCYESAFIETLLKQ
jgi:hypothetical protein